jgi:hypothetical protein
VSLHKEGTCGALLISRGSLLVMMLGEMAQAVASINTTELSEMVF